MFSTLSACISPSLLAQPSRFSNTLVVEARADLFLDTEKNSGTRADIFSDGTGLTTTLSITPSLDVLSTFVIEPVLDTGDSDDNFFSQHGIYNKEFYLHYQQDRFGLLVGKHTVNFGRAWDVFPEYLEKRSLEFTNTQSASVYRGKSRFPMKYSVHIM